MTGIEKACEAVGGQAALAQILGVSRAYINQLVKDGRTPPKRCLFIHELTGVSLHELNPDIYPRWAMK